jgi:hypothetical protein
MGQKPELAAEVERLGDRDPWKKAATLKKRPLPSCAIERCGYLLIHGLIFA